MFSLLLNAKGRIQKRRFWQGMVILTGASVLMTAGSVMVSDAFGFLILPLVYMYICVFGKRLHDAGLTAWWVIGVFLGNLLLNAILQPVFRPFLVSEEAIEIEKEISERLLSWDMTAVQTGMEQLAEHFLPLNLLLTVICNFILALGLGMLATMPKENKHGPVPGQA